VPKPIRKGGPRPNSRPGIAAVIPPKYTNSSTPVGAVPPHPSEWVGKTGLSQVVKDAIQHAYWEGKEKEFTYHSQRFSSLTLMTLEVYCYARGIYSSWDVESYIQKDPFFRELFPGELPAPEMIRKFRREHHDALKQCLLSIFDQAFLARFGDTTINETPMDFCVANALDRWFEPITGPQPAVEAAQRIDQAIFWDGMKVSELEG
jgi:hypothetical protein